MIIVRALFALLITAFFLMINLPCQATVFESQTIHFADASNADGVSEGKVLYKGYCSGCHGRNLQGQALWQLKDAYEGRRAPAHDASGHTWQHSDEALFQKTKTGNFEGLEIQPTHAFYPELQENQILAILAYIKARWPLGIRISQSTLNPGFKGMPEHADSIDWSFPPSCNASRYSGK